MKEAFEASRILTVNLFMALEKASSSLGLMFFIDMEITGSGINMLSIEMSCFSGVLESINVSPLAQVTPKGIKQCWFSLQ